MSSNPSNRAQGYKALLDRWRAEGRHVVTRSELAKALGVSLPTVSSWEIPDAGISATGRRHYVDDVERTLERLAAEADKAPRKQARGAKAAG